MKTIAQLRLKDLVLETSVPLNFRALRVTGEDKFGNPVLSNGIVLDIRAVSQGSYCYKLHDGRTIYVFEEGMQVVWRLLEGLSETTMHLDELAGLIQRVRNLEEEYEESEKSKRPETRG